MALCFAPASTHAENPTEAVADLRRQLPTDAMCTILFCAPTYGLEDLGAAIHDQLSGTVIGCTTSGQIGPAGYQSAGITAAALSAPDLSAETFLIAPLDDYEAAMRRVATGIRSRLRLRDETENVFGLLLVDGLSMKEEHLMGALYEFLPELPIVGGSAGDDLQFREAFVLHEGRFRAGAATLTLFRTHQPVELFKIQHHVQIGPRAVVTGADPDTRTVHEINGHPAVPEYAKMLGLEADSLTAEVAFQFPLVLRVGGHQDFIRSVKEIHADGRIEFYCAVERGTVVSIGKGEHPIETLREEFERLRSRLGSLAGIIGFDCVLRRIEFESQDIDGEAGTILAEAGTVGFSTYGEQYDALHMNQTLVGVAFGGDSG